MGLQAIDAVTEPRSEQRNQWQQQLKEAVELLNARMVTLGDQTDWTELELTMTQMRVLGLLACQPRRMSEIAAAVGSSVQAAAGLIDRLVDRGLVAREHDTVDRRVVYCRLTANGRTEIERFYRIGQTRMELLVDVLADDELEHVVHAMRILAEAALRRQQAQPAARAAVVSATAATN